MLYLRVKYICFLQQINFTLMIGMLKKNCMKKQNSKGQNEIRRSKILKWVVQKLVYLETLLIDTAGVHIVSQPGS